MLWKLPLRDNRYAVPPNVVLGAGIFTAGAITIAASKVSTSPEEAFSCGIAAFVATGAIMTLPALIHRINTHKARILTTLFRVLLATVCAAELALFTAIAPPFSLRPTVHDIENRIYAAGDRVDEDVWRDTDACRSPQEPYEYRACASVRDLRRQLAAAQSGHPLPIPFDPIAFALWAGTLLSFWTIAALSTMGAYARETKWGEKQEIQQGLVVVLPSVKQLQVIDLIPETVEPMALIGHRVEKVEAILVDGWHDVKQ